jgi:hypothetical protein
MFTTHRRLIASVLLITLAIPLPSQAENSSFSFCEMAKETGSVCPTLDKDAENFSEIFKNAVLNVLLSTIEPTITTASPYSLPRGSTADLLLSAPKAEFNSSSLENITVEGGIIVNGGAVLSETQLKVNVTVPSGTPLDFYDIQVETENEDGELITVIGRNVLQIVAAPAQPQILSIDPIEVSRNATFQMLIYAINTHFTNDSVVQFSGTGLTVSNVIKESDTRLQVTVDIAADAEPGFRNVTVTTDSEIATENQVGPLKVFQDLEIIPKIIQVTPRKGQQGQTLTITLEGKDTNWVDGSEVKFEGDNQIEVLSTTISSPTKAQAEISITADASLGYHDVYVITGAETATRENDFTVLSPVTITLDKNQGQQGTDIALQISGNNTHFLDGTTQIQFTGGGITVNSITITSETEATVAISIAADAPLGKGEVLMVTGEEIAGQVGDDGFEIVAPIVDNHAPTEITLNNQTILAHSEDNTVIGEFTTTDPDTNDNHTYGLINDAAGRFKIVGKRLLVANQAQLDTGEHNITVVSTDSGDLTVEKTFTITVTSDVQAPTAIELTNTSLIQSSTPGQMVGTLSTVDINTYDTFTYSLPKNPDDLFVIEGDKLSVAANQILALGDYDITVRSTDSSGESFDQDFTIRVIANPLADISLSGNTVPAHSAGYIIGHFSVAKQSGSVSYTLIDDADGRFRLDDGRLIVANSDALTADNYEITVVAESAGEEFEETFQIIVTEKTTPTPNEPPQPVNPTPQPVDPTPQPVDPTPQDEFGNMTTLPTGEIKSPNLCEGETTYAIQPAVQNYTLTMGETPIISTFTGGEGEVNLIQVPDAAIVTLGLSAMETSKKVMQLVLTPRQVGKTQLKLGDECNNQASVNITVVKAEEDDDQGTLTPPDGECQADSAQFIQPSAQTITMAVDEAPSTLTFTQIQGKVQLVKAPDGSIVTLDMPIFAQDQLAQVKLTPRKVGQTQLVLQDCTGKQAKIDIIISEKEEKCTAKPLQLPSQITMQMGDQPITLPMVGGQEAELVQAPDPTIVTFESSALDISWLKLTPRQPGHTQLTLKNCTGEMTTNITVLNPKSLGGICWQAGKTDGICKNADFKQPLPHNAWAFNADGEPIEVESTILGQLDSPVCDTQTPPIDEMEDEMEIETGGETAVEEIQGAEEGETGDENGGEMTVENGETQISDDETAVEDDEIAVEDDETAAEIENENSQTGETEPPIDLHNNPFCLIGEEFGENCNNFLRRKLIDSSTACAIGEDLVLGEEKPITLTLALIADESHRGLPAHRFLFVERETNDQHRDYLMYDGNNWQLVVELDLNQLITVESYDALPAIVESTYKFSLSEFPDAQKFGTFTVHFGYQLENGTLVFNNSQYQPIQFIGANSVTYPAKEQEPEAYFKNAQSGTSNSSRTRTEDNGETSEAITITSTLKPAQEHLGKPVDIIMVAIYQPTTGEAVSYMRMPSKQWIEWDGKVENLIAAKNNETLSNNITFEIFQGELSQKMPGAIAIYIGYRLTDNTIIFNGKEPLMLSMP